MRAVRWRNDFQRRKKGSSMKKDEFLYGALLHLGMNMWSDRP